MFLGDVFERFVAESPVSVMVRAVMQNAMSASALDEMFMRESEHQYTKELLFSTQVDLMSTVVLDTHQSVNAAFQAARRRIPVSVTSVYNKLNGIEPNVSAALTQHTASRLAPVIESMGGQLPPLLPGYRVKIFDGNHLAATDRRLAVLRGSKAGPLPGFGVVILDPSLMLATNVIACEDGHAQERSLSDKIVATFDPADLGVADRNFCTRRILFGIDSRKAFFAVREHATNLPWESAGARRARGRVDGGRVYEQRIHVLGENGEVAKWRRITVRLDKPTRDGETEIHVITNLSASSVKARAVAILYRNRWTLETLFQDLERALNGEIKTLAYPKAALFAFCIALAAYNVLSTVKAALRAAHGHEKIEAEVSEYYLADEISGMYRGMMVAIPPPLWERFASMGPRALGHLLLKLAADVYLPRFRRHPRGPKKPVTPRTRYTSNTHVSTARLLADANSRETP
jgi:hypothetical protein